VRLVLLAIVLSDIREAVFARQQPTQKFTWFCDESQNLFLTQSLRDMLNDLLTMSRSFGTFFMFISQNLSAAVQDARMLQILHTNVRWSFSMRGDPNDNAFLKPVLPVTGRRPRPRTDPFTERTFYSASDERGLILADIANLPNRTGWLWLRGAPEAIPIRTSEFRPWSGREAENAVANLLTDQNIGGRISRQEHARLLAERESKWRSSESVEGDEPTDDFLERKYRSDRDKER
jgi:hypothetical protein